MSVVSHRDFWRPWAGTVAFQPFAFLWCWLMQVEYLNMIGPFIVYSTLIFIPIYVVYERMWDRYEEARA